MLVFDCGARGGRRPALIHLDAVSFMPVLKTPRGKPAFWLLAVVLSAALAAAAQTSSPAFKRPSVPLPAPVNPSEMPAAFTKESPATLDDLREMQDRVAELVARVSPAVVGVEVGNASGSGVVISEDGLVLTAGHVADWAGRRVKFTFPNGKTARGKTLGVDEDADTGLMRITDPGAWPHAPVGDMKRARLGDWTLALGNPGGFDSKRSLVARLGRIVRLMPGVVQTDCTISPGDSGGPLFDMYGRVIAIHTAIATSMEENFHVPITEFFATWSELSAPLITPKPPPAHEPAYSGLSLADDPEECRLSAIEKNSPAAKAGLKPGDEILKVDGRRIEAAAMFRRWLAESAPGETLHLEIQRGSQDFTVSIKLQPLPRTRNK
ncbi:MAG TPA: S1C family serine protease [Verrucomicrobiae bacterium]|jgi:serine protease Do